LETAGANPEAKSLGQRIEASRQAQNDPMLAMLWQWPGAQAYELRIDNYDGAAVADWGASSWAPESIPVESACESLKIVSPFDQPGNAEGEDREGLANEQGLVAIICRIGQQVASHRNHAGGGNDDPAGPVDPVSHLLPPSHSSPSVDASEQENAEYSEQTEQHRRGAIVYSSDPLVGI
jgi:hypothetical protein